MLLLLLNVVVVDDPVVRIPFLETDNPSPDSSVEVHRRCVSARAVRDLWGSGIVVGMPGIDMAAARKVDVFRGGA